MKTSELTKLLVAAGCYIIRRGGNHDIWFSHYRKYFSSRKT